MTSSVTRPHCTLFAGRAPRATCVAVVPSLAAWPGCPPTTHRQLSLRGRGFTLGLVMHFTFMRVRGQRVALPRAIVRDADYPVHKGGSGGCPTLKFLPHTLCPLLCVRGSTPLPTVRTRVATYSQPAHGMSARGQCGVMQAPPPQQALIWRRDTGSYYRADW